MTTETALTEDLSVDLRDAWDGYAKPPFISATGTFARPVPRLWLSEHGRSVALSKAV
jgi:hypothetical protein